VFSLPVGQFKLHTRLRRMRFRDKCEDRLVKTCETDERWLTNPLAGRSPSLWQALRMIPRKWSGRCIVWGVGAALIAALVAFAAPVGAASARAGALAPEVERRDSSAYTLAQNRPGLRQRRLQRGRPINERRRRRRPDAFRGLMTPGPNAGRECRRPRQVRRRLQRQGWWDFSGLRRSGRHFAVRARRPNGTVYRLTIERCTGRVLKARPVDGDQAPRLWAR